MIIPLRYLKPRIEPSKTAFLAVVLIFLFSINSLAQTTGFEQFRDRTLDSLLAVGLTNNPDLKVAANRVLEARKRVEIAQTFLLPNVRLTPLVSYQSLSATRPVPFPVAINRASFATFQIPFEATYELDVFRRLAQNVLVAELQTQLTELDGQIVRLAVASEIARLYFLIRYNDEEQGVFERNLSLRDSTLQILKERFRVGLISQMDIRRTDVDIANLRAQRAGLERSRTELVNGLAVLCGLNPAEFELPKSRLVAVLPRIPYEQAEESYLNKRPDILQANKAIEAADAQVRVAELARKPRIAAFGTVGPVTGQIENLVLPKSGNYLVGASASIPVFEGRRNIKNVELAEQQRLTQKSQYDLRLLTAKREAEVAFDQLRQLNQQLVLQRQALTSAQQTEAMARELYVKGLTVYLDVLDTQRSILEAERQITLLEGAQFIQTVALLRALGGEF